jgi:hypothetical protein
VALLLAFRGESRLTWSEILRPRDTDLARYVEIGQRFQSALRRRQKV